MSQPLIDCEVGSSGAVVFLPFKGCAEAKSAGRPASAEQRAAATEDLEHTVAELLYGGAGGHGAVRRVLDVIEPPSVLTWGGGEVPIVVRDLQLAVFPSGAGFLWAHFEVEEAPTLHRVLQANNRARVDSQPMAQWLRRILAGIGVQEVSELTRLPTYTWMQVEHSDEQRLQLERTLDTAQGFYRPELAGLVHDPEGGPSGSALRLTANLRVRATLNGAVVFLLDRSSSYARKTFPVSASRAYFELYLLAIAERWELTALHDRLRELATSEHQASSQVQRVRRLLLRYRAAHRVRDVSHDERRRQLHAHFLHNLSVEETEKAVDTAMEALQDLVEGDHQRRLDRVALLVSAVLFPLTLATMIFGMNIAELGTGAIALFKPTVFWPVLFGYVVYLGVLWTMFSKR